MDLKTFMTIFGTVFLAELGDKTQLATLLFSADRPGARLSVFIASASALILASAIGVAAGGFVSHYINPKHLQIVAGIGFILIGAWTLRAALI